MARNIQLRRDPASTWTTVDPILAEGEIGYELDTGKLKVGNGTDNWSDLSYRISTIHNDLTGRGTTDAHPINAITNLQTSLDDRLTFTDTIDGGAF